MTPTKNMARAALLAGVIAVCAWTAIPIPPVSFTLQTFAVCLSLGLLGGKWGSVSILLYLLLGAVGLPVFSGFRGGIGTILGPTGGFLWGFLAAGPVYRLLERLGPLPGMIGAMAATYLCGCLWYTVYAPGTSLWGAFLLCGVPYLLPEAGKIALALSLAKRIKKHIP